MLWVLRLTRMGWGATVPPRTAAPLSIRATGLHGYSMGERMHNARHAKPASTTRRVLLGGLAAVTAAGLGTLAFTSTGNAATTHQPTRGYARTCAAFAQWNAAGIPSYRQLRTLAHDAARMETNSRTLANDTLQADVATLVLTVVGRTDGSPAAVIVAHDCGND